MSYVCFSICDFLAVYDPNLNCSVKQIFIRFCLCAFGERGFRLLISLRYFKSTKLLIGFDFIVYIKYYLKSMIRNFALQVVLTVFELRICFFLIWIFTLFRRLFRENPIWIMFCNILCKFYYIKLRISYPNISGICMDQTTIKFSFNQRIGSLRRFSACWRYTETAECKV